MLIETQIDMHCSCGAALDIVKFDMFTTPGRTPRYKFHIEPCRECSRKKPSPKQEPVPYPNTKQRPWSFGRKADLNACAEHWGIGFDETCDKCEALAAHARVAQILMDHACPSIIKAGTPAPPGLKPLAVCRFCNTKYYHAPTPGDKCDVCRSRAWEVRNG